MNERKEMKNLLAAISPSHFFSATSFLPPHFELVESEISGISLYGHLQNSGTLLLRELLSWLHFRINKQKRPKLRPPVYTGLFQTFLLLLKMYASNLPPANYRTVHLSLAKI